MKINLRSVSNFLSDNEKKLVLGGSSPGGSDTCTSLSGACNGNCPDKWE